MLRLFANPLDRNWQDGHAPVVTDKKDVLGDVHGNLLSSAGSTYVHCSLILEGTWNPNGLASCFGTAVYQQRGP